MLTDRLGSAVWGGLASMYNRAFYPYGTMNPNVEDRDWAFAGNSLPPNYTPPVTSFASYQGPLLDGRLSDRGRPK